MNLCLFLSRLSGRVGEATLRTAVNLTEALAAEGSNPAETPAQPDRAQALPADSAAHRAAGIRLQVERFAALNEAFLQA